MAKVIPVEELVILQHQLDQLPARSSERKVLIKSTAEIYRNKTTLLLLF